MATQQTPGEAQISGLDHTDDATRPSVVGTALTSRPVPRRGLQGRRALVIGGSRGIGAAVARRLGQDGARVGLTWASRADQAEATARAVQDAGGEALVLAADSMAIETVHAAIERTVSAFGGLDILVHSAGIAVFDDVRNISVADLDRALQINVRGAFLACQAAARHMGAGGRIIVIGSVNSERVAVPGNSLYAMTKAALAGMVRGMARDLAPLGITVNNVQPGPIDTDMNPASGPFAELICERFLAIPRYGTADEVAGLVAYVASAEAGYLTGASLLLDGGFAA